MDKTDGMVIRIQRFCVDDGPGIRTTVFLKGCNLRCEWCHNGESYSGEVDLGFHSERCKLCGKCGEVCPNGVHRIENGFHSLDREVCIGCGRCVNECPADALAICGTVMTASRIMKELLKDNGFYQSSGGGITLSGGEPLLQAEFCLEIAKLCKEEGVSVAVETAGHVPWERFQLLLPWVEHWLFDYKESNEESFRKYTGGEYGLVVENLKRLSLTGGKIILRCPIIPGVNDREDHFAQIKKIKQQYEGIKEICIMPYHSIGEYKKRVYGAGEEKRFPVPTQEDAARWKEQVNE